MQKFYKIMVVMAGCAYIGMADAEPLGTSFTYQGRLNREGAPVTAPQDLQFRLYDASAGGVQVGTVNTISSVAITNGIFTVPMDFGAGAFGSNARYLEIKVRESGSGTAFTTLSPRQPVTPAPVALSVAAGGVDEEAVTTGAITREKLSADFTSLVLARTTTLDTVQPGPGFVVNFNAVQEIDGFSKSGRTFIAQHSGFYAASIGYLGYSELGASVELLVNGKNRYLMGKISSDSNKVSYNETWVQLAAGDAVSIEVTCGNNIKPAYLYPTAELKLWRIK